MNISLINYQLDRNFFSISAISLLLFFMVLIGCSSINSRRISEEKIIGIKIYNISGDTEALFKKWTSLGINTVFASPELVNDEFKLLANRYNIKTFLVLPIFYNPDMLKNNPDLYAIKNNGEIAVNEWVKFVCPSRTEYRKQKIEYIISLITKHEPDGLSLDFIRHFVYWEKVYPDQQPDMIPNTCYCPHCINSFSSETGIVIPASIIEVADISDWINNNYKEEWINWRKNVITTMVKDISEEAKKIKPSIKINIHAVPWRQNDFNNAIEVVAGQDFKSISAYVDIISPMCYAHMLKRKPEWINSVVEDISLKVKCKIAPSIQVNMAYLNDPLDIGEFKKSLIESLKPPSSGVIFWSWEQLVERQEKLDILKDVISSY